MLPLNKLCNVEDFADESLAQRIAEIHGARPVSGREERKSWEVGMAALALQTLGAARPEAEILGVGAGHEATVFHLTNVVRRVFATDLYLTPGSWERTALTEMLASPERFWGGRWNPRRLVVQHMDATDLRYEDGSFDGVFSSSSIEHFGTDQTVRRSAEEMCRVLRPGGICSVSTEFRIRGGGEGIHEIRLFSDVELQRLLVEDLPWDLVDPLDLTLSTTTAQVEVNFLEASDDVIKGRPNWSTYPHIVLTAGGYAWTSVHLALRRRRSGAGAPSRPTSERGRVRSLENDGGLPDRCGVAMKDAAAQEQEGAQRNGERRDDVHRALRHAEELRKEGRGQGRQRVLNRSDHHVPANLLADGQREISDVPEDEEALKHELQCHRQHVGDRQADLQRHAQQRVDGDWGTEVERCHDRAGDRVADHRPGDEFAERFGNPGHRRLAVGHWSWRMPGPPCVSAV
jgi:SAM-dependent methyltransferase